MITIWGRSSQRTKDKDTSLSKMAMRSEKYRLGSSSQDLITPPAMLGRIFSLRPLCYITGELRKRVWNSNRKRHRGITKNSSRLRYWKMPTVSFPQITTYVAHNSSTLTTRYTIKSLAPALLSRNGNFQNLLMVSRSWLKQSRTLWGWWTLEEGWFCSTPSKVIYISSRRAK